VGEVPNERKDASRERSKLFVARQKEGAGAGMNRRRDRQAPGSDDACISGPLAATVTAQPCESGSIMQVGMRQAGIEPATSRSGGARSIP
jgi:hypothetical protein